MSSNDELFTDNMGFDDEDYSSPSETTFISPSVGGSGETLVISSLPHFSGLSPSKRKKNLYAAYYASHCPTANVVDIFQTFEDSDLSIQYEEQCRALRGSFTTMSAAQFAAVFRCAAYIKKNFFGARVDFTTGFQDAESLRLIDELGAMYLADKGFCVVNISSDSTPKAASQSPVTREDDVYTIPINPKNVVEIKKRTMDTHVNDVVKKFLKALGVKEGKQNSLSAHVALFPRIIETYQIASADPVQVYNNMNKDIVAKLSVGTPSGLFTRTSSSVCSATTAIQYKVAFASRVLGVDIRVPYENTGRLVDGFRQQVLSPLNMMDVDAEPGEYLLLKTLKMQTVSGIFEDLGSPHLFKESTISDRNYGFDPGQGRIFLIDPDDGVCLYVPSARLNMEIVNRAIAKYQLIPYTGSRKIDVARLKFIQKCRAIMVIALFSKYVVQITSKAITSYRDVPFDENYSQFLKDLRNKMLEDPSFNGKGPMKMSAALFMLAIAYSSRMILSSIPVKEDVDGSIVEFDSLYDDSDSDGNEAEIAVPTLESGFDF